MRRALIPSGRGARPRAEWQHGDAPWIDTGLLSTRQNGEALHPEDVTRCFRIAVKKATQPITRPDETLRERAPLLMHRLEPRFPATLTLQEA